MQDQIKTNYVTPILKSLEWLFRVQEFLHFLTQCLHFANTLTENRT